MRIDLISFMKSQIAPRLGLFLGNLISQRQAYRIADFLAIRVASRKDSPIIQALHQNLAVVHGCSASSSMLDPIVRNTLRNAGRALADWYLAVSRGPEFILKNCHVNEQWEDWIQRFVASSRGVVLVGGHIGSYNIPLMILGVYRIPVQILSEADPQGSYRVDNALRRKYGADITPVSERSLRRALKTLQQGGLIVTAVDRADENGEELTFFGRKAKLPVGHVRLALRTDSCILVGLCNHVSEGRYRVLAPHVIEPHGNAGDGAYVRNLAQKIISVLEDFIRQHPEEWYMFHPVWPG